MAQASLLKNIAASIIVSTAVASTASAFSYKMNAMCFMKDSTNKAEAFNPTAQEIKDSGSSYVRSTPTNVTETDIKTKFRVASLSKILVTHWATATLGPEYRFKTRLYITPTNPDKTCYVHLAGDGDIFMGKEMLSTVFKQLKPILTGRGCTSISQLSYDEKFVVPMGPGSAYIVQHRDDGTYRGADPDLFYGPLTTQKALTHFVRNYSQIRVKTIKPSISSEFKKYAEEVKVTGYSFQSRPLYMMMREFNAYSSNVPPNILFERLGGVNGYKAFIKNRLGMDESTVVMMNGSGYPVMINDQKIYNEVTCESIVRIIQDLDHMLKAYKGSKAFQLADVMAVGGDGEHYSTFKSLYGSDTFDNTLTGKTGSADKAITFGGALSTTDGNLYFAVLTEPDIYDQRNLNKPRTYIRDLVSILAERVRLKKFDYTQVGLMNPIDSASTLVAESNNLSLKMK